MTSSMFAWYPLVRNCNAFATRLGVSRRPSRVGSSPSSFSNCLTRSCISLLYICVCSASAARAQDADAFYADRQNLASAKQAADIWAADLVRDNSNFEAAWKLARVSYWLGTQAPAKERRELLERGVN